MWTKSINTFLFTGFEILNLDNNYLSLPQSRPGVNKRKHRSEHFGDSKKFRIINF